MIYGLQICIFKVPNLPDFIRRMHEKLQSIKYLFDFAYLYDNLYSHKSSVE